MKLLDNFSGLQASHSLHWAVAYHIKIGNAQIIIIKLDKVDLLFLISYLLNLHASGVVCHHSLLANTEDAQ